MIDLMASSDGDIPLFIRIGSGNESDKTMFASLIKEYENLLSEETIYVADSALYTSKNLHTLGETKWISRVPSTIKKAKELLEMNLDNNWITSEKKGYSYQEKKVNYHGIEQRWLIVLSESRKKSDLEKLAKNKVQEKTKIQEQIQKWTQRKKKSLDELKEEVKELKQKLKYHNLEVISYRKELNSQQIEVYSGEFELKENQAIISLLENKAGKFILATNVLDEEELSSEEMLLQYKNQLAL